MIFILKNDGYFLASKNSPHPHLEEIMWAPMVLQLVKPCNYWRTVSINIMITSNSCFSFILKTDLSCVNLTLILLNRNAKSTWITTSFGGPNMEYSGLIELLHLRNDHTTILSTS